MEYLKFFGLDTEPFQNDLDARFYFESAPQKRARMRVLRGIQQRKALSVVYGGPGRGKTTLAHHLLKNLLDEKYALRFLSIPHEGCSSGWFLPNVARQYGIQQLAPTIPQLVDQVHGRLVEMHNAGKYPVIFVDEAQLFRNQAAMEEFRGLLNLLHDGQKLVSMVLFGLEELSEILRLDPPLAQRVDIRVELEPMDRDESAKYLEHRLKNAGGSLDIFTSDAIDAIYAFSGGVPRVVNTLADNTLFDAFLCEANPADGSLVASAADSLGLSPANQSTAPSGLELDLDEAQLAEAPGIASVAESNEGAASWVEPPAPMPDSLPPLPEPQVSQPTVPQPAKAPVGPAVDPSVLDEAAAALETIAMPEPAGTAEPGPTLEFADATSSPSTPVRSDDAAEELPAFNREFDAVPHAAEPAPAAQPTAAAEPVLEPAPQPQPESEPVPAPEIEAPSFAPVAPPIDFAETRPLEMPASDDTPSVEAVDTQPSMQLDFDESMPSIQLDQPIEPASEPPLEFVDDIAATTTPASQGDEAPEVVPELAFADDDDTPVSLASVISPEKQEELRKLADAPAAPSEPAPVATAPVAAPPETAADPKSDDGSFHLGSILDDDDAGPPSLPTLEPMTPPAAPAASPAAAPVAPVPAAPAAAAPAASPAAAPQAAATPATTEKDGDGMFDLSDLLEEVQDERDTTPPPSAAPPAPSPAPAPAAAAKPRKPAGPKIEIPEGEDDLDSLFDSIQISD